MAALSSTVDEELARIARAGHGVVTRGQLLAAGVTRHEIAGRLRRGALLREHPGVYRVGHRAPSIEATYLAAVFAAGEEALLGGLAAAHLLGLVRGIPPPPEVIARSERRIEGVRVHRSRVLSPHDVTTVRACHEAGVRYRTTPAQVEEVLGRRPNAPGARKLRLIVQGDVRVTLSTLEARFLQRLGQEGLPLPVTNRPAGGRRVDCRWAEFRLTVELDGYRFHNSRYSWERDRRREREARARGDEFRRYSYGDVTEDPTLMLSELRALLRPTGNPG
jgi:hypothetical protein